MISCPYRFHQIQGRSTSGQLPVSVLLSTTVVIRRGSGMLICRRCLSDSHVSLSKNHLSIKKRPASDYFLDSPSQPFQSYLQLYMSCFRIRAQSLNTNQYTFYADLFICKDKSLKNLRIIMSRELHVPIIKKHRLYNQISAIGHLPN